MRLPIATVFLVVMTANPLMAQRSQTTEVDVSLPAVLAPTPRFQLLAPSTPGASTEVHRRDVVAAAVIGALVGALAGYLILNETCGDDALCGVGLPTAVLGGAVVGLILGVMIQGDGGS